MNFVKILLLEDDADIVRILKKRLPAQGFVVDVAATTAEGIALVHKNDYMLVLLDIHLPDGTCDALIRELKTLKIVPPILMLTAAAEVPSRIRYLQGGADDYIIKPFAFEELTARMRAVLRRPTHLVPQVFSIGELEISLATQTVRRNKTVRRNNKKIYLTRKEFMLLEYLLQNRGTVMSKSSIHEQVWDSDADFLSTTLETHISNLRRKLQTPELIETVHGRGYVIT